MDVNETTEALAAIGMMLQGFPSARSSITADSAKVYFFAVEELSLEALKRACRAIVRGEVADLSPEFPPTAPKLAQIVKSFEGRLKMERFEQANRFVEQGSVLWQKLSILRKDNSLPSFSRELPNGKVVWGWFFPNEETELAGALSLPAPASEEQLKEIDRIVKRRPGYSLGDADGDRDVA